MSRAILILPMTALLAVSSAVAQDQRPVVKAKEPSTVTVYGSADKVKQAEASKLNSTDDNGIGRRIKRALAAVSNGTLKVAGWMLGVDDDVPPTKDKPAESPQ
jgi:hypothetical protein